MVIGNDLVTWSLGFRLCRIFSICCIFPKSGPFPHNPRAVSLAHDPVCVSVLTRLRWQGATMRTAQHSVMMSKSCHPTPISRSVTDMMG